MPARDDSDPGWESRPGGIWVRRGNYTGDSQQVVTDVYVLFGVDAVDPRPHWHLLHAPLQLDAPSDTPAVGLSVRYGRAGSELDIPPEPLRAKKDGTFKILQISDTHLVTGVGVCKDAVDAHGQPLPESEADPLTIAFLEQILNVDEPDFVILTGDQLDSQMLDSQSAIFKLAAPLIKRSIHVQPFPAIMTLKVLTHCPVRSSTPKSHNRTLSHIVYWTLSRGAAYPVC